MLTFGSYIARKKKKKINIAVRFVLFQMCICLQYYSHASVMLEIVVLFLTIRNRNSTIQFLTVRSDVNLTIFSIFVFVFSRIVLSNLEVKHSKGPPNFRPRLRHCKR